jgi:1-pyrroline-4-hydroxy-2-carboxylate deaminase
MQAMQWRGVIPAITTQFHPDGSVDQEFLASHCGWLIDNGCTGIVALGSLGEGGTLSFEEKVAILRTAVAALAHRAPVIAGISALSTAEAIALAKAAQEAGCAGLMVLPPYVYVGDWREMKAHVSAVLRATPLSCMLYNNPIAYRVDFLPEQVLELVQEHENLHAIKESSADVRRVAALRSLVGERLEILCGVDDLVVEAIYGGVSGWIAGLANALPRESVELFELARRGEREAAFELYKWFLPLLRFDTVPKFVHLIKYVQELLGMGSARVRPPRLELTDEEKRDVRATVEQAMRSRNAAYASR